MATKEKSAIERLLYRAELRSAGDDEDTGVIEKEIATRNTPSSTPAPAKGFVKAIIAILNTKPSIGAVVVVLALFALVAFVIGRGIKVW